MKLTGHILETIRDMIANLSPGDMKAVINERFDNLILYHNSYGMNIRNQYKLFNDNQLQRDLFALCDYLGIEKHPDSCSQLLIEQMWCRIVLDNVDMADMQNIRDANKELIQ